MWNQYVISPSVGSAVETLKQANGDALIIAGGTDVVPQYRDHKLETPILVDITRIPDLNRIEEQNGEILIGAAVTHAQAAGSPLIQKYAAALAQGCAIVGSPQIRNQGTLAGNIVNAQPAADGAIALIALDAKARITSADGQRIVPVYELYEGIGKSRVNSRRELIEQISFHALDPQRGQASAVERLSPRKALSLPMVNVAVSLGLSGDRIDWVRIAIGPVAVTPYRPSSLEQQAHGLPAGENVFAELAQACARQVNPRSSRLRGSSDYRKAMVGVLVQRALVRAWKQAIAGMEGNVCKL